VQHREPGGVVCGPAKSAFGAPVEKDRWDSEDSRRAWPPAVHGCSPRPSGI